jgi:hypothetical protein
VYIYKATPHKGSGEPNPLLEAALAYAQHGYPILPARPYWLHPHIQHPCPYEEPICLATGWHVLTEEFLRDMTRKEATIRE